MTLAPLLAGKRLVICAGPGGTGKTTCSAAVSLGLAAAGATVAVITIDPARRLADALGLRTLDNEPRRVPLGAPLQPTVVGELWAMALDPKRTFDELIDQIAPSPARAAQIKSNRIYHELSQAISGSQEFTAVSKLFDLGRAGRFDVVVLDTPPAANALDFLDAPGRLSSFLDGRAARLLTRPTGFGIRVLGRTASPLMGALSRLSGVDLLADAASFFALLGGMTGDFGRRADAVEAMLRAPTTALLLITSAERYPVEETIGFGRTLVEEGLGLTAIVVNRVHEQLGSAPSPAEVAAVLEDRLPPELAARVAASAAAYNALARRQARCTHRLRRAFPDQPIVSVPQLPRDVDELGALGDLYTHLF